jgi:hypothetical protein
MNSFEFSDLSFHFGLGVGKSPGVDLMESVHPSSGEIGVRLRRWENGDA